MSLYRHIETGVHYLFFANSFCVKTQAHQAVYIQVETGRVFNRPSDEFLAKFELLNANPQEDITAKPVEFEPCHYCQQDKCGTMCPNYEEENRS